MNINAKCRIIALAAAAMAASAALAMPTKGDFVKAQPVVNELMNPLVKDFKAEKTTAEEVGAKAVEYAREAETEAAKFLLLKGAITYYARAEKYDKAADAVDELGRVVKDIPPDTMLDIISRATSRISEANAPRLHAQYRLASSRAQAEKEIAKLKPLVAKRQVDDTLRRRYAEALAASGNWKAALDEFAKAKGTLGEIAAAEKSGKGKAGDVAEFWWGYKPEEQYVAESTLIKWHAAEFYKKALAEGSLSGLKKTLAEKRVASLVPVVESPAAAPEKPAVAEIKPAPQRHEVAPKPAPAAPVAVKDGPWTLPKTFQTPLERSLDLGRGVSMPFCACPAGTFMMLDHKVTITRPFWFTKTPVTLKQRLASPPEGYKHGFPDLEIAQKINKEFMETTIIPYSYNHHEMIACLNSRFKRILPPGYVFRFPTEAEFYYAWHAKGDDLDEIGRDIDAGKRARDAFVQRGWVSEGDKHPKYDWANFAELPEPNAFGIQTWRTWVASYAFLDTINVKGQFEGEDKVKAVLQYADEEVDPLRMTGVYRLSSKGARHVRAASEGNWGCLCIVIGPDLESEKAAAKK